MIQHTVPLAVDSQVRVPIGPVLIPLRTVALLALSAPPAMIVLELAPLALTYRIGLAASVLLLAAGIAAPEREGVWIATWWVYRLAGRLCTNAILEGGATNARILETARGTRIDDSRRQWLPRALQRSRLFGALAVPTTACPAPGLLRLEPGGCRAVLLLEGPASSITSPRYAQWSDRVIRWLMAVGCPAQLLTILDGRDAQHAELSFDGRTGAWARSPLLELERTLAGRVAEQSVRFRIHVVLAPGMSGHDGLPRNDVVARRSVSASADDAQRALESAVRVASGMELVVRAADRDDLAHLLRSSLLGATSAAASGASGVQVGEVREDVLTVTQLPPALTSGVVVDTLLRARVRGAVGLHLFPVMPHVARKLLDRRAAMLRYSAREGNDSVDNHVALAEASNALAAIAHRDLEPCRVALTLAIRDSDRGGLDTTVERVHALLSARGFALARVTVPGFLGSLAASPGCPPLRRSMQLTSTHVAACLLPALGTPFARDDQPLVGMCVATGAPAYVSVWSRPNYNALILGSSGAGKSVAAKTLLTRHVMSGCTAVIIDPDSEYRRLMNALGGRYLELGDDALNVLAVADRASPDDSASLVLPVLSVMAGDEKGVRDGRPIRRLADEDQAWLFGATAEFFQWWRDSGARRAPVLSDLAAHLEDSHIDAPANPSGVARRAVVSARLRRFAQGHRAHIFDRGSGLTVDERPVAIGLRAFALTYAADLTPALAVVLTAVLAALVRPFARMLVLVDEAHRVTADPDAGAVLGQLVRQARKHGTGVWMCSQRADDFLSSDLGQTLVATAATKLILGVEEAATARVREAFSLDPDETAAISPICQGRGVLISGAERAVVDVVPGAGILALADTTPALPTPPAQPAAR